jgi:hypothetical protein
LGIAAIAGIVCAALLTNSAMPRRPEQHLAMYKRKLRRFAKSVLRSYIAERSSSGP